MRTIGAIQRLRSVGYLPRFRLCRLRARSFLYLCFRIFFRRFLMTLPIDTPELIQGGSLLSAPDVIRRQRVVKHRVRDARSALSE